MKTRRLILTCTTLVTALLVPVRSIHTTSSQAFNTMTLTPDHLPAAVAANPPLATFEENLGYLGNNFHAFIDILDLRRTDGLRRQTPTDTQNVEFVGHIGGGAIRHG